jgi:hypothetical protein
VFVGAHLADAVLYIGRATGGTPGNMNAEKLKRLGMVGFLFFLIKGLAWLLLPLALYSWSR